MYKKIFCLNLLLFANLVSAANPQASIQKTCASCCFHGVAACAYSSTLSSIRPATGTDIFRAIMSAYHATKTTQEIKRLGSLMIAPTQNQMEEHKEE